MLGVATGLTAIVRMAEIVGVAAGVLAAGAIVDAVDAGDGPVAAGGIVDVAGRAVGDTSHSSLLYESSSVWLAAQIWPVSESRSSRPPL